MFPVALLVFLLLHSFASMSLSANLPSLILPVNASKPSDGPNITLPSEETPSLGTNPFRFTRPWPPPPFAWRAERDVVLHFESYEHENIENALLKGLKDIIPNSFSIFMMYRGLDSHDAAPLGRLSFPAPSIDIHERPLPYSSNVQVDFLNTAEMPGAAYRVGDMEKTIRAIIKKVRSSRVGHYAIIIPEIGGYRYKKVYVQRRT